MTAQPAAVSLDDLATTPLLESLFDTVERVAHLVQELTERDGQQPIVVLVSRRMSCVYEMLVLRGFIERFDCEVVSDRVLAAGPEWRGRSIILYDDSLIVGTTLARRFIELARLIGEPTDGPSERIATVVAAVDEGRHNSHIVEKLKLLDGGGNPKLRSTKELQAFSKDVTRLLYQQGMPYFSDFPMTLDIPTTEHALSGVLTLPGWDVTEVKIAAIAGPGQTSYTLFPTDATTERFRKRLAIPGATLLEKIRIYVRPDPKGSPGEVLIRIVPIAVPEPLRPGPLEERLRQAAAVLRPKSTRIEAWLDDWAPQALHRLLQFYLSSALLAEFWATLHNAGIVATRLSMDRIHADPIQHYFGPHDYGSVERAFDAAVSYAPETVEDDEWSKASLLVASATLAGEPDVKRVMAEIREAEVFEQPPIDERGIGIATPQWAMPILSVFGTIAESVSAEQEKDLQELTWDEYVEYNDKPGVIGQRVLDLGITVGELALEFCSGDTDGCTERTISTAIDIANDTGVAVPTTTWSGGDDLVYRHYRPGENAVAVEAEIVGLGRLPLDEALQAVRWLIAEEFGISDGPVELTEALATTGGRNFAQYHSDLQRKANEKVPNRLAEIFTGVVVSTTAADFSLQVRPQIAHSEMLPAVLPRSLLGDDAEAVTEGAIVKWQIMTRKSGDRPDEHVSITGFVEDESVVIRAK